MKISIKIIAAALLCLFVQNVIVAAQTPVQPATRKISEMIADYQKLNGLYTGTFKLNIPKPEDYDKSETTILGVITFPNSVKVKYLAKTREINRIRKDAVNKWWKDFGGVADKRYFFVNEIKVKEDSATYWIMADENHVITKLEKTVKKNRTATLKMRILGYHRKGRKFDFFLMAENVE